ncbi:MAG TPA: FAD-dependent oxidoreductase [Hyphomonadaceae bacterium]|nr:FAD-dependent oxidoreductase [Hyphomonadaceae bacterium]
MSVYREKSRSCWMDIKPPAFPALDEDLTCDVAIVGSGIAGLSTAYELAKTGKKVVVLDRGPIARGMTARTTAHITTALDDYYYVLIDKRGEEAARQVFAAQAGAADRIGAVVEDEGIGCDYARVDGAWFLAGEMSREDFDREWKALAMVGATGVSRVERRNGHRLSEGPSIIVPRQGRFHPLKYLDGVAAAVRRMGGKIYADTCISEIEELKTLVKLKTESGRTVRAQAVVLATNSPIKDDAKLTHREEPQRTYAFAAEVPKGAVDDVLYWDTERPYHYVRLQPAGDVDLLISGGEDHGTAKADDAEARFARLEAWTKDRFPEMGRVRYRWSGQVLEPEDHAGFIGLSPGSKRLYLVTGDSGQGITHGVAASLILPALIDGQEHPWAEAFAPERKRLPEKQRHKPDDAEEVDDRVGSAEGLSPGEGGTLKHGKEELAISRDSDGRMHRLAASCSHEGCTVHWNSFEQCWDCPCHGSQFAPDGTALNAPAVAPLEAAKAPDTKKTAKESASS